MSNLNALLSKLPTFLQGVAVDQLTAICKCGPVGTAAPSTTVATYTASTQTVQSPASTAFVTQTQSVSTTTTPGTVQVTETQTVTMPTPTVSITNTVVLDTTVTATATQTSTVSVTDLSQVCGPGNIRSDLSSLGSLQNSNYAEIWQGGVTNQYDCCVRVCACTC